MMPHKNVSLALVLTMLLTGAAQGEMLLFQQLVNINRSSNPFDTDQFDLDLNFGDDFFAPTNGATLFDDLVISPDEVGATYDATQASDPNNFATVADRVTDGLNEIIKVSLREHQVGGLAEQRGWQEDFFFGHPTPPGPPDLAGNTVVRVSLRVDAFTFVSSAIGSGVAPLVTGQPFDVDLTLSFYVVPEPAAGGLLLFGLMALGAPAFGRRR